ncbi:MAG: STAS domain-containing protein [Allorhizobium sp.]
MLSDLANSTVINLEKSVTIRNISDLLPEISAALSGPKPVAIKLADTLEVDLSFVQLIESARLSARANGKTLSLAQPASGPLLEVLQRGGFIESASDEDAQFWLHKGSVQ